MLGNLSRSVSSWPIRKLLYSISFAGCPFSLSGHKENGRKEKALRISIFLKESEMRAHSEFIRSSFQQNEYGLLNRIFGWGGGTGLYLFVVMQIEVNQPLAVLHNILRLPLIIYCFFDK
ncbi:MAG: hypothetical protein KKC80_08210 [Candidatus Margulisbacteria bacterium]|nr:hypothetical protein [Candidatus Margulisiibacteriota bacterium]MBU1616584.1 hypothetical protein [Candidatus Margulisiibacteriota bacterium]